MTPWATRRRQRELALPTPSSKTLARAFPCDDAGFIIWAEINGRSFVADRPRGMFPAPPREWAA